GSWLAYHRELPPLPAENGSAPAASDASVNSADLPVANAAPAGWSRHRVRSVLIAGLVVFFVYTGLEVSAGQWEASYLRGHLGVSASAAGLAAFGYWSAVTAVRIG